MQMNSQAIDKSNANLQSELKELINRKVDMSDFRELKYATVSRKEIESL